MGWQQLCECFAPSDVRIPRWSPCRTLPRWSRKSVCSSPKRASMLAPSASPKVELGREIRNHRNQREIEGAQDRGVCMIHTRASYAVFGPSPSSSSRLGIIGPCKSRNELPRRKPHVLTTFLLAKNPLQCFCSMGFGFGCNGVT